MGSVRREVRYHFLVRKCVAKVSKLNDRVVVDSSVYFQNYPDQKPDVRDVDATGEGHALCPCGICQSLRFQSEPGFRWAVTILLTLPYMKVSLMTMEKALVIDI